MEHMQGGGEVQGRADAPARAGAGGAGPLSLPKAGAPGKESAPSSPALNI